MGESLARKLTKRALACGHRPRQERMTRPLNIQGVGNGSQQCEWEVTCPIAVTHMEGDTHLHEMTTPIVRGSGADLPGLLGLRSLEHKRAILDCGRQMLIFPGKGDVEIVLPPGSLEVPLQKAPSGHLVMVIDEYEQVVRKAGGLPTPSMHLHASVEAVATSSPSSSSTQPPPSSL